MEFQELIQQRRSIRDFAEETIDQDVLASILAKAQMAPSWKNGQPARCYAVTTPEQITRFREATLPEFNQKSSANAAYIVTTFVKDLSGFQNGMANNELGNLWGAYDLGLHDAYLILAASDAGYDTLIMGIRDSAKIRELLSIPEEEEIVSVIAIGKRHREPVLRPRKELNEVVHFF